MQCFLHSRPVLPSSTIRACCKKSVCSRDPQFRQSKALRMTEVWYSEGATAHVEAVSTSRGDHRAAVDTLATSSYRPNGRSACLPAQCEQRPAAAQRCPSPGDTALARRSCVPRPRGLAILDSVTHGSRSHGVRSLGGWSPPRLIPLRGFADVQRVASGSEADRSPSASVVASVSRDSADGSRGSSGAFTASAPGFGSVCDASAPPTDSARR